MADDGSSNNNNNYSHSVTEQLARLEEARKLVLGDAAYYGQIVQGILPIIGANARLEVRRWGTEFLAEAFASPVLAITQKQSLSLVVLDTLKAMLADSGEDPAVLKSVVQASASIYPLVFRHIISNANDNATWEKMTAIKSAILKMWDSAAGGVRICCIKFVQRVIQVQTPGSIADPRRPEQNEVSLAIVPRSHALIPPPNLEAEASGLLDRLLSTFHDNRSDALVVNATLNCLGVLVRTRPSIANKIISAVLNFNPLEQATQPLTPKQKVMIKSMERTTRALLVNVNKQNPNGPMASRIQQYIDRLVQSRIELMDEGSKKRGAPSEPTDGLDQSKRVRLGAELPDWSDRKLQIPPLPSGPISLAQLFTLTTDAALTSFDVKQIPMEMVVQLILPVIYRLNQGLLDQAIGAVRSRIQSLPQQVPESSPAVVTGGSGADEEEDDYEPEFEPAEDDEQILNKLDSSRPSEPEPISQPVAPLGHFRLPQPPPLNEQEIRHVSQDIITRAFRTINVLEEPSSTKKPEAGLNRLAASNLDRNAWITLITRIATRAPSGLEDNSHSNRIKKEDDDSDSMIISQRHGSSLSDSIRESLYVYVIEDFRRRIDTAIGWLNEEWYNDQIQLQQQQQHHRQRQHHEPAAGSPQYEGLALRILDGILPYLDARDKLFTRFVSELPGITQAVLERVKSLARDPERVGLAVNTLHYLILFRPPVREICLDALEDLWRNYDDARQPSAKLLQKWRPHVVAGGGGGGGVEKEHGNPSPSPSPAPREDAANTNSHTYTDGETIHLPLHPTPSPLPTPPGAAAAAAANTQPPVPAATTQQNGVTAVS